MQDVSLQGRNDASNVAGRDGHVRISPVLSMVNPIVKRL